MQSEALLMGRIVDDRRNRMSPTHACKGRIKYRHYLSSALIDGRPEEAGSGTPCETEQGIIFRELETRVQEQGTLMAR
jgi:hypothetical protein